MLGLDKTVKANAEAIIGKPLKNASIKDIKDAFKNIPNDNESLQNIYKVFKNVKDNKYINYAKTMNSFFGALSTLALVPMFMIWLARYCDRMTKNDRAKEKLASSTPANDNTPKTEQSNSTNKVNETKQVAQVKEVKQPEQIKPQENLQANQQTQDKNTKLTMNQFLKK